MDYSTLSKSSLQNAAKHIRSGGRRFIKKQYLNRSFFLHIHSSRVHLSSLRPGFTLGLGVAAAVLFLVLLVTGALLMLYYTPSVERAYASVKDIIFIMPGGRTIRNMHRWAGHGLVLIAFLHLARVFYTGAYSKGRTLNWIIGVALLVVTLFFSFSGYLLPWDQLAYWAVTIGANIAASFGEITDALGVTHLVNIGGFVKRLLIGGESVGQSALTRFFMLHVLFLPILFTLLMALHFWRIRKDGGLNLPDDADKWIRQMEVNSDKTQSSPQKIAAWPTALWGELAVAVATLALLVLFAYLLDAPLKEMANPAAPENPAKSPWYFVAIQELVSFSAFTGGIVIPLGFIAFLLSIPFVDKKSPGAGEWFAGPPGRRVVLQSLFFSTTATICLVFITIKLGWLRDWLPRTPQLLIILINPGTILTALYVFWAIFIRRRTGSQRNAALALFTCAMMGLVILTVVGLFFRGPDWEFYWSPLHWPKL